ncbi:MAG: dihydroorotate dehydrogenase [Candidatus Diapherotrites archaeon CG08_land_8_20_14_0_20_34_12]|nr:MAG: dihydroorotate dehydrogenase [Candidatus Diapherotrites archaeon CG08_land_8_20_14_0_20_34_12]
MSLQTNIAGLKLKSPLILASGVVGISAPLLKRCEENGAGAVTLKSIGPNPRAGHKNPTVLALQYGIINAVGLSNVGYKNIDSEIEEIKKILKIPFIVSIFGEKIKDYKTIAAHIAALKPNAIELNVSCPNVEKFGSAFGLDAELCSKIVSDVKNVSGSIPIIPKLTPQANNIADIAKACEDAGADAICAINTAGPGMVIDIETAKPMLTFKKGGLSGPMIKPIAIRCVYDIYEKVRIPIIGTGGIVSGKDAIEIMQAGASCVGIGSAVYYNGFEAFGKINKEMQAWMKEHNYKNLDKLRGIAHG